MSANQSFLCYIRKAMAIATLFDYLTRSAVCLMQNAHARRCSAAFLISFIFASEAHPACFRFEQACFIGRWPLAGPPPKMNCVAVLAWNCAVRGSLLGAPEDELVSSLRLHRSPQCPAHMWAPWACDVGCDGGPRAHRRSKVRLVGVGDTCPTITWVSHTAPKTHEPRVGSRRQECRFMHL